MPTCPNGHQSGHDDWCEVCGHRMGGSAVPPPPPPPPVSGYGYGPQGGGGPAAQSELCPQCRTPREALAPFCEECRWNFLTNTATSYTPIAPPQRMPGGPEAGALDLPPSFQSQPPMPPDAYEYQGSRPSQINRPAEPLMSPTPPRGPQASPYEGPGPDALSFDTPGRQAPPFGTQAPSRSPYQPGPGEAGRQNPPAPPGEDDWMLPPPSQRHPLHPGPGPLPGPGRQGHPQPPGPAEQMSHAVPEQPQYPGGPVTAGPARWAAVIGPDRDYFMAMMQRSGPEATGLNLPAYSPEQRMPLGGTQVTIGRRRHSTGESPDIDLSVPPEDPGVSHQHAVLVQQPDGSWAVVDQNSTNGTTLNGGEEPIQPYVPIPLNDGDRVHVGAWTTIRIVRD
jgi:FHA domain